MTSTKERQQRAAARARLAREMAERQAAAKQRRKRALIGGAAAAVLLVAAGTAWAVVALTGDEPDPAPPPLAGPTEAPTEAPVEGECAWYPVDPNTPGYADLTEVGTPPPVLEPPTGISTLTMETSRGTIALDLDLARVPCTAASFAHLAGQEFYDGTACHRMTDENIFVLQCGDPTGTSGGGPTYRIGEENLPVGQSPTYPAGSVAMAKSQDANSTGSQFFIVYEDTELPPDYTLLGTITEGLEIVQEVAAGGHDGSFDAGPGGGLPNEEIVIETLRVSDPA